MSNKEEKEAMDWYEQTHKHWRSWGSWLFTVQTIFALNSVAGR